MANKRLHNKFSCYQTTQQLCISGVAMPLAVRCRCQICLWRYCRSSESI